jgi:hypothetical protein
MLTVQSMAWFSALIKPPTAMVQRSCGVMRADHHATITATVMKTCDGYENVRESRL